jgi:hypothetical protein
MRNEWNLTPEDKKAIRRREKETIQWLSELGQSEDREVEEFFVFPDWFPKPAKDAYQILLSNLLGEFRHRWPNDFQPYMLRQWINTAKEWWADPTNPEAGEFDRDKTNFRNLDEPLIYELARNEYGAGLPMIEGLEFIADKNAVRGAGFSRGGVAKKGNKYEPKLSIKTICEKINSFAFNNVIAVLRDADQCVELYESTEAPINVQIDGVDDDQEVICFRLRGRPPNKGKTLTFGRLRNILSEIKPK